MDKGDVVEQLDGWRNGEFAEFRSEIVPKLRCSAVDSPMNL